MALSMDYRSNGVPKARRVPRSIAGFRQTSRYVAAIDFGTACCSLAYALPWRKEIFTLPLDGPCSRVPNAILIEKENNTVKAFGYRAQRLFATQKMELNRYVYFERMKMILYRRSVSLCINTLR